MTEHKHGDSESNTVNRGGRPSALTSQHILVLHEIVSRMPHATLDELAAELSHLGGVQVCAATIRRAPLGHVPFRGVAPQPGEG
jgi:transposase